LSLGTLTVRSEVETDAELQLARVGIEAEQQVEGTARTGYENRGEEKVFEKLIMRRALERIKSGVLTSIRRKLTKPASGI
jgi:hypothetical protein